MTCIAGLIDKKNNKVIIGADSGGSTHNLITKRKDEKVFKLSTENGEEFVFGCSGSFRMMQIIRYGFKIPIVGERAILEFLSTDFATAIRELFTNNGFEKKSDDGSHRGTYFLIGYKNRLFSMEDDFQIGEYLDDFTCLGSGEEYAYGALQILNHKTNKTKFSAEEKVKLALETSAYFCPTVCSPFILEST